jgi:hypothetical protein
MKALKILGIAVAVLVLLSSLTMVLVFHHFTGENGEEHLRGAIDRVWEASAEPELKRQVASNEAAVREALGLYREAQAGYKERHGRYAESLADLSLPAGMAEADLASTAPNGFAGYRFGAVPLDGALENNPIHRYTLCAVPAAYRLTGVHTYTLDSDGGLLYRDNFGIPVQNTVELSDGTWEPVVDPTGTAGSGDG